MVGCHFLAVRVIIEICLTKIWKRVVIRYGAVELVRFPTPWTTAVGAVAESDFFTQGFRFSCRFRRRFSPPDFDGRGVFWCACLFVV